MPVRHSSVLPHTNRGNSGGQDTDERADDYIDTVAPATWGLANISAQAAATMFLRDVRVAALRDLAPNTGAYMSEVGPPLPFLISTRRHFTHLGIPPANHSHASLFFQQGDPTEPNWQQTFWGGNYPALFALKQKYDPNALFYCVPCVGSEFFVETNGVVCTVEGGPQFIRSTTSTGNATVGGQGASGSKNGSGNSTGGGGGGSGLTGYNSRL